MSAGRRASDHFWTDLVKILMTGDMQFACVILGFGMALWGVIGVTVAPPQDLIWFSRDFIFPSVWFWFINHVGAGTSFVWCAVRRFPHPQSLFLGAYSTMIWTFIAVSRPVSSFTSGMTLNLIIILMGTLLIYRSGKK